MDKTTLRKRKTLEGLHLAGLEERKEQSTKRVCTPQSLLSTSTRAIPPWKCQDPMFAVCLEGILPVEYWPRGWRISTVRKSIEACVPHQLRECLGIHEVTQTYCNIKTGSPEFLQVMLGISKPRSPKSFWD
jgi:hypothetical protein